MKINIHEIPNIGIEFEEEFRSDALDVEREDIEYVGPIRIKALVQRQMDNAHISMQVRAVVRFECGRCLEDTEKNIDKDITLIRAKEEGSIIDLIEIAREEIMLDYPIRFLCKESCKGICPHCGRNLNLRSCGCADDGNLSQKINLS